MEYYSTQKIATNTGKNMDESQSHNVERKKPDTKEYMLYGSIDMNF